MSAVMKANKQMLRQVQLFTQIVMLIISFVMKCCIKLEKNAKMKLVLSGLRLLDPAGLLNIAYGHF